MPDILDYKASVPNNGTAPSGVLADGVHTLPTPVVSGDPPILLADLGMFLPTGAPNRVECKATVGLRVVNTPVTVLFEVIRDGSAFFAQVLGFEPVFSRFFNPTILAIDHNVSAGFHIYQFRITLLTGMDIEISRTIEFSGLALSLP